MLLVAKERARLIEFLCIDAPHKSAEYDKGILFEQLVKRLVESSGFSVTEMRRKQHSLEYDIAAESRLGNTTLIGEAKALDRKISPELLQFIGKMLVPWAKDPDTLGLFISTSPLTADVSEYAAEAQRRSKLEIIAGSERILDHLAEHCGYPSVSSIGQKATEQFDLVAGECIFAVTDRGDYFVQLLTEPSLTVPTKFVVYSSHGVMVNDETFFATLRELLPVLRDLSPLPLPASSERNPHSVRSGSLGIVTGKGWFDYKLPAPPSCFVGRGPILERIESYIDDACSGQTGVRVFEVLSRSGVGKSSLSIKVADLEESRGNVCVVVDSRGLESGIQLVGAYDAFCRRASEILGEPIGPLRTMSDLTRCMASVSERLSASGRAGILIFDQFESLFARPAVYTEFVDSVMDVLHVTNRIIFGIARKSDQFATYDESARIDLTRITSVSQVFDLKDFDLPEAEALIDKVRTETGRSLSKDLRAFVLEFTDGFPWLLKRICAHIIELVKSGKSQRDIIDSSFQLQDLFDEELSSLDEFTKDFLLRVVYHLPATVDDLSDAFAGEEHFRDYLDLLQHHRIIRLTGRTYDTYNDVLKEYLKTGRVSINVRYIPRQFPKSVLGLLDEIYEKGLQDVEAISRATGLSVRALWNTLRELRELGLIVSNKGQILVSDAAERSLKQGTLPDLLRTTMKQNLLVRDVLRVLNERKTMSATEMVATMRKAMPFTTALDSTWTTYARILGSWLRAAGLAHMKDNVLYLWGTSSDAPRMDDDTLPGSYMQHVHKLMVALSSKDSMTAKELCVCLNRSSVHQVCKDSMLLGLVKATARGYSLTADGTAYVRGTMEVKRHILADKVIKLEAARRVLELMRSTSLPFEEAFQRAFEHRRSEWTTSTEEWRRKLLGNWLTHAGLLTSRRRKRLA